MKKQSYDVPAYKFGIVKIDNHNSGIKHSIEEYKDSLTPSGPDAFIIPFEDIDGLTVSELQALTNLKEVFLISYYWYETTSMKHHMYVSASLFIEEETLQKNLSTPIDQVIEIALEKAYIEDAPEQKRICQCFFQRYQDKSYKKTKERIKRLEN